MTDVSGLGRSTVSGTMVWRDGGSRFAASTLRKAFDAARGDDGAERAASAAVVAALLPHVEANERTLANA